MQNEKRRLAALAKAARPANSLAARLATLTDAEKGVYRKWREANDHWHSRHKQGPGGAYAAMMAGNAPPRLPRLIREKLFEPTPMINAGMAIEELADIYRQYASGT